MNLALLTLQSGQSGDAGDWVDGIIRILDSPLPFSPLSEYLLLLFIFWLLSIRRRRTISFDRQAQDVLDEKYGGGELSDRAYQKYRQDLAIRPKR